MRPRTVAAFWIALCSSCADRAEPFTVRSSASEALEIRYFITGSFGGYGSFVNKPDADGAYRIPLEQEGKPAKTLKAILYAPGCRLDALSYDMTTDAIRSAGYECRPLPVIRLHGKIAPAPAGDGPLDVSIFYMAPWSHPFFGIADGAIVQFDLGKAQLNEAGEFAIPIPDFSHDPLSIRNGGGYLKFVVIDRQTGNLVERVKPPADFIIGSASEIILSPDK